MEKVHLVARTTIHDAYHFSNTELGLCSVIRYITNLVDYQYGEAASMYIGKWELKMLPSKMFVNRRGSACQQLSVPAKSALGFVHRSGSVRKLES